MKNLKKVLICLIAVLFLVTSCGKVPTLENGQDAVVTIEDGDDISVDDLYEEMKDTYALSVLLEMIDTQILEEVYPTDDEETEYIESQIEQIEYYYEYYYSSSYSSLESFLYAMYGVQSEDEVEELLSLSYKRDLATDDYAKTLITDEEIEEYYEDEIIGDIEASHILITAEYDDDATDDEIEEAEQEAYDLAVSLIEQLDEASDDEVEELFAELAEEYSDDSATAEDGGKLDAFNKGDMVEAFEEAAIALEVGEYSSEPVESEYGYHIILKTGQEDKPELEDVEDEIIEDLVDEKESDDENLQYKALKVLREDHGVEIQDTELKKQYKTYLENYASD